MSRTTLGTALAVLMLVGLGASPVLAADLVSVATGNWNAAGTWSPAQIPTASDNVTIASGHIVTLATATNNAGTLTVNSGGTLQNTLTSTYSLTVANGVTNNGTITYHGGTFTVTAGGFQNNGTFNRTYSSATYVNAGGLANAGTISRTGTGVFYIYGGFTNNGGYTNSSSGDMTLYTGDFVNNTGATWSSANASADLTISAGDFTNSGSFTHWGIVSCRDFANNGTFDHGGASGTGDLTATRDFTNASGASFDFGTSTSADISVGRTFTNNAAGANFGQGIVIFNGAEDGAIAGLAATLYRVQIGKSPATASVTMNADLTITYNATNALDINSGSLITNGHALSVDGASSRAEGSNAGALRITGGSQAVIRTLYQSGSYLGKVVVDGSGTVLDINGVHTLNYYTGPAQCSILGGTVNYKHNGTTTNSSLYFNATGASGAGGWFATGGTVNFDYNIYAAGNAVFNATDNATIRFTGSGASTVQLANTATTTSTWSFNNLVVDKTGGAAVSITSNQPLVGTTVNLASLTVNSGSAISLAGSFDAGRGYDIGGDVQNAGTVTFSTAAGNDYYVAGNWTNSGTFNHGGRVVFFDGSGDATLDPGASPFYDITVEKTGTVALAADLQVQRNLVVSAGVFSVGEHSLTLGTGTSRGSVTVQPDGIFSAVGSALDAPARVLANQPGQPYGFAVYGQVSARYAEFSGMNNAGIVVIGIVDPANSFSYCSFDHGSQSGPMLRFSSFQPVAMERVDFSGSAGYNILKTAPYTSGQITVTGGGGDRWGEDFEFDLTGPNPNGLIDWVGMPGPFELTSPADGATNVARAGNLQWQPSVGASSYDVYLGTSPTPEFYRNVSANECSYDLPGNTPHYWTVEAKNIIGTTPTSSGTWRFSTMPVHDAGVTAVIAPSGNLYQGRSYYPRVAVSNYGQSAEAGVPVRVVVTGPTDGVVYDRTEYVDLGIGESRDVAFADAWLPADIGGYQVVGRTELVGDDQPDNDDAEGACTVSEAPPPADPWVEMKSVPGAPSNKQVKDGGWLVAATPDEDAGETYVYVAKGNKTGDFCRYEPEGDSGVWTTLDSIPSSEGGRAKLPKKGCAAATDGESSIYMTKGNNTAGFWKYHIAGDSWQRLPDVPLGADGKKVKGGTDLAYAVHGDTGWVYLMKGYKTSFYRYNTESNVWDSTLTDMPYGIAPKYNAGSFLAYDGGQYLYAHQAKYTDAAKTRHFMFRYDLATESWDSATGMPVLGMDAGKMKSKKSKDGGSGAWYDGKLYALKGGNTCQFYAYDPAPGDSWVELDTIKSFGSTAKKKKVKAGGDLASYGSGVFFALKGNKTNEFWRYVIPTVAQAQAQAQARSGVASDGRLQNANCRMQIAPSPIADGYATINYSLPKAGPVTVSIIDVAGRSVHVTRSPGYLVTGSLPLDLRGLSAGVYLVRLDADGFTQSRKLVVQR